MSEENSNNINPDFLRFLQEQCGGQDAAELAFRKHLIKKTFNGRQSDSVTMGEILDHIDSHGWTPWFKTLNIVEFLNLFRRSATQVVANPAKSPDLSADGRTARQNVEDRINVLMAEFERTPWISKPNVAKLLGLKSTPTVDKVMNEAFLRGLIKKYRGRTMFYAKANETCPPPT